MTVVKVALVVNIGDLQAEWTQNFGGINVDEFDTPSGPQLPDGFDVATATPIKYFDLLFPERIFEVLKNNTNHYAEFHHDQRRIDQGNPNYEDTKWHKTSTDEMWALFGVMIIMGIQYLPQDRLYWDKDEFIGNSGIRKTFTVNRFHKLMEYLHISDRATEAQRR